MDNDEIEFRRLVRRRTELIESMTAVCDSASGFALELEAFALRTPRNRAAVEKIFQEVVAMREACQRILEQLQRQPTAGDEPPLAIESSPPPARETGLPDYLKVIEGGQGDRS